MKIRTLAKVFASGLIATSMAAALPMGVSADTAEAPAATQSAQTIRFAKVTAVSASSITVAFGEDQRPEKKEKPAAAADGQLPTPPADNSDAQGSRPARKERPASTDADTAAGEHHVASSPHSIPGAYCARKPPCPAHRRRRTRPDATFAGAFGPVSVEHPPLPFLLRHPKGLLRHMEPWIEGLCGAS